MKQHNKAIILILGLLLLAGCSSYDSSRLKNEPAPAPVAEESDKLPAGAAGKLTVHFIDVGQADAILVQTPAGETMLIDAGGNDDEQRISAYLQSQQIKSIQVLVGTHPHEDHIGAMDKVIYSFPVEQVYLPKITHNTRTFEELLQAVKNRGLKIKTARAGVSIPLTGVDCIIVSPVDQEYKEINDYSAVIKLSYGKQGFLFCGDAGETAESAMLAAGAKLQADVLKVAHHGSSSGSSARFLQAVSPRHAVISCGLDNPYGHPHQETLQRLQKSGINILRTDQSGTIIMSTDGNGPLEISTERQKDGGC